jgi:hypothetical protein
MNFAKGWVRRKEKLMVKESEKIGTGSVLEKFELISYDKDTGRMLARKKFDDGSEWYEPVAISIPDLFCLFKIEGIDPSEMVDEERFEFHSVRIEIVSLTQAPFDDDFNTCSDSYYYQVKVLRS